jgi:hypothetical protein
MGYSRHRADSKLHRGLFPFPNCNTRTFAIVVVYLISTNEPFHGGIFNKPLVADAKKRRGLLPSSFFF